MNDPTRYYGPEELKRWRTLALFVGAIGTLVIFVFGLVVPGQWEQVLRSWLIGYVFWAGISIGCLGLLMVQYLTGGAWGVVARRVFEAGSRTLFVTFGLFIPLAIGVLTRSVYNWTHLSPTEHVMQQRGVFMTPWSWVIRTVIYF